MTDGIGQAADRAAGPIHSRDELVSAGRPEPLGATWDGVGTNFALYSSVATAVDLCLFREGQERRLRLASPTRHVWHAYVEGVAPGTRYGFRVHGPWQPDAGLRCNPAKLLIDPYAREIAGDRCASLAALPYVVGSDGDDMSTDDSADAVPLSVVVDPQFDWEFDRRPGHRDADLVIYELHVKGFTMQHPDIPADLRGTYAGLAHPAAIAHLTRLGITAVELMPVHAFVHDMHLVERGLTNYWGYNTVGFFAPHPGYASPHNRHDPAREFKGMVKALHAAGIEVILDVVYNHTAEGNHLGPMLSFRGIDNPTYYCLVDPDRRYYQDFTGTGNSLNASHPQVLRLVLDSLRYWVTEMHVDGFRFDLAVTPARMRGQFDPFAPFLGAIHQDPVLRQVRLIAEPWDVGDYGYRLGQFPVGWSEWNARYRDTVRDFWRSADHVLPDFATRLVGSADLFEATARPASAGVNFVTSHDGFSLQDLVSHNDKHNEANGEDNRDGHDDNRSWNLGIEGPTDDRHIVALRRRQRRNFLATLLLSKGTPMVLHGDELGRTQQGNNNAYCQDSPLSWIDWSAADQSLVDFLSLLIRARQRYRINERTDLRWFRASGKPMSDEDWARGDRKAVTLVMGPAAPDGETLCLCMNAHLEPVRFTLPKILRRVRWRAVVDTRREPADPGDRFVAPALKLDQLSLLLVRAQPRE